MTAALDLCARGLGDTVTLAVDDPHRAATPRKLAGVAFDPPLYDTFAFITRRNAHLSPATREFIRLAEKRVQGLQRQLTAED